MRRTHDIDADDAVGASLGRRHACGVNHRDNAPAGCRGCGKRNHGPLAAAGNRRALIAAAIEVFGEYGVQAPLNQIAKRAGVGQGSLYRHFPTRIDLALAVYEQNADAIEQLAAQDGTSLDDLLSFITELTIQSVAIVNLVTATEADPRLDAVTERVFAALDPAVRKARGAKQLRRSATTTDVMLAISMVASLLARIPADQREACASDCWKMLRRSL